MRKAILLAAVGSTRPEGRRALKSIDTRARQRFAGIDLRWAFTSSIIRRKLARQGLQYDSFPEALQRLRQEGYTHVAVQSLHIAKGADYAELAKEVETVRSNGDHFDAIALGGPLLGCRRDVERGAEAVLGALPRRRPGDAVVLMGHGSPQGNRDLAPGAVASVFRSRDPLAFFGRLTGEPGLEDVLAACRKQQPKRAWLLPFMTAAGYHARTDLAGDGPGSWKSQISDLGIECLPVLTGLGENPGAVDIWMDQLAVSLQALAAQR